MPMTQRRVTIIGVAIGVVLLISASVWLISPA